MNREALPPCSATIRGWDGSVPAADIIFGKYENIQTLRETFVSACASGYTLWETTGTPVLKYAEGLLARFISEGKRERKNIRIAAKYDPPSRYRGGDVRNKLTDTLGRLGVPAAEIYYLTKPVNIEENMLDMARLLRDGKIKNAGVAGFGIEDVILADDVLRGSGYTLGAVMNRFSLISRSDGEFEIIGWCRGNGTAYFAGNVLEQGALTGKYDSTRPFPSLSPRGFAYNKYFERLRPITEFQRELGRKYGVSPAQIAVSWAVSKGARPSVALKKPEYVTDLKKGLSLTLEDVEISRLDTLSDRSGLCP